MTDPHSPAAPAQDAPPPRSGAADPAASLDPAALRANLDNVAARAAAASTASGRGADAVSVLLATKTQPAAAIRVAIEHGFTLIGENRVQELTAKADALAELPHEAHVIGPLQKNKVNHALRHASCVQSIDSVELAHRLQRRLEVVDAHLEVFIQVNTSGEESKSGVTPHDAAALINEVLTCDRLRLRGLMTIGLPGSTNAQIRPSYADLRELSQRLRASGDMPQEAWELSMGMSNDFELAIAEGATMVRVGSSVFGARPRP